MTFAPTTATDRPTAIGYIRVSTDEQSRDGVSLDMQAAKIRAYAELNDLHLTEIVEDAGISGKTIRKRPGVQRVLNLAHLRQTTAIIVYKLDRLARNTRECLEIIEGLDKAGVSFHSITEKLDTQSAVGRFVVTIIAALGEMERGLIGERTRAALQHKKSKGERLGGDVPFGYVVANDGVTLEEDEDEQRTISLIKDMTSRPGSSYRAIALRLNEAGRLSKRGGPWSGKQVARIVTRFQSTQRGTTDEVSRNV